MRLTEYLAPLFADDPLILIDVGARGGLDAAWSVLGASVEAYCFDADEKECARLMETAPRNVHYFAAALAGSFGPKVIYETRLTESSGLYQTNQRFFGRLLNSANAAPMGTRIIDTITLDKAREDYEIPHPEFIKLDVEGAELDILQTTDLSATWGFYSEFRFHREINGCPTFAELDRFAVSKGFMLYDINFSRQSRKALPYSGPRMNWSNGERFHAYTSGGQVMDGNALYMRDPLLFRLSRNQVLKMACLFEIFKLNDCAAELLIDREKDAEIDLGKCLDLLAGGSFVQYMEKY